jgi:hypothetical protein
MERSTTRGPTTADALVAALAMLSALAGTSGCADETRPDRWRLQAKGDTTNGTPDATPDTAPDAAPDADTAVCPGGPPPTEPLANCRGTLPDSKVFASDQEGTTVSSLELGSTGCPRVLYERGENITFTAWNGTEWASETVASIDETYHGKHLDSDLAVDACGRLSVGFLDEERPYYAHRRAGDAWNSEPIGDLDDIRNLLHAVTPDGRPAVVLKRTAGEPPDSTTSLHYAVRGNDGWNIDRIHRTDMGLNLDDGLEFDSRGRPHVAFLTRRPAHIYHAVKAPSGDWTVDEAARLEGTYSAHLAIGPSDRPHILVTPAPDSDVSTLYHLYETSDGWQTDHVEEELSWSPWAYTAAFDGRGRLHAMYIVKKNIDTEQLRHAVWEDGDWKVDARESGHFLRPAPRFVPDSRSDVLHSIWNGSPAESSRNVGSTYRAYPLDEPEP